MSQDSGRYVCLNCSQEMEGLKCKIRCTRCGYFESCSDLEAAPPIHSAGSLLQRGLNAREAAGAPLQRGPNAREAAGVPKHARSSTGRLKN